MVDVVDNKKNYGVLDKAMSPVAAFFDKGLKLYYSSSVAIGKSEFSKNMGKFLNKRPAMRAALKIGIGTAAIFGVASTAPAGIAFGSVVGTWFGMGVAKAAAKANYLAGSGKAANMDIDEVLAKRGVAENGSSGEGDIYSLAVMGIRNELKSGNITKKEATSLVQSTIAAKDRRNIEDNRGLLHRGIMKSPTGRVVVYGATAAGLTALFGPLTVGVGLGASWAQERLKTVGVENLQQERIEELAVLGREEVKDRIGKAFDMIDKVQSKKDNAPKPPKAP